MEINIDDISKDVDEILESSKEILKIKNHIITTKNITRKIEFHISEKVGEEILLSDKAIDVTFSTHHKYPIVTIKYNVFFQTGFVSQLIRVEWNAIKNLEDAIKFDNYKLGKLLYNVRVYNKKQSEVLKSIIENLPDDIRLYLELEEGTRNYFVWKENKNGYKKN